MAILDMCVSREVNKTCKLTHPSCMSSLVKLASSSPSSWRYIQSCSNHYLQSYIISLFSKLVFVYNSLTLTFFSQNKGLFIKISVVLKVMKLTGSYTLTLF